jgi:integrase
LRATALFACAASSFYAARRAGSRITNGINGLAGLFTGPRNVCSHAVSVLANRIEPGREAVASVAPAGINPCRGVRKNKEKPRDFYADKEVWDAVYTQACPELQDAMDINYLTGQRPGDVLRMKDADVREGALHVRQERPTSSCASCSKRAVSSPSWPA